MSVNWTLYRTLIGQHVNSREAEVTKARADFEADAPCNPAWMIASKNGVEIGMLIKASENPNTKWFNAAYDCGILCGDVLCINGCYWICTEISDTDDVTLKGCVRQCNLNLQFQIGNSTTIYSRWCFFDKGVYSTTLAGGATMQTGDMQFKIHLPYDEQTKFIRRDKRLATEVLDDPDGSKRLSVFKVTATDSVGSSFGAGKLLELKVREDMSDGHKDNIQLMVCDYVDGTSNEGVEWV